jgi:hypothetical protein
LQTVYIQRVENVGRQLVNVEFDKVENVRGGSRPSSLLAQSMLVMNMAERD